MHRHHHPPARTLTRPDPDTGRTAGPASGRTLDPRTGRTPDPGLRVGDAERSRVVDQLADHHAAGRLTLEEFEERMASAWTARTGADLEVLVRDLPPAPRPPRPPATGPSARLRPELRTYLAVIALLWLIWLVTGADYPWPVWPMLGWGIGLAGRGLRAGQEARPSSG